MTAKETNKRAWQRGIALITALLVMSLATVTAVSLTTDQQLFYRRTQNMLNHEQAYQYLLGAEDWGKQILARDFDANKTDSLKDDWATVIPPIPVEGGNVGGTIEDLQGRFNINNLADPKDKVAQDAFRELLAINKIPQDQINAVMDWLDADQNVRYPDGAEDADYMQGERAYRAANGLMSSVSELLYIKGFDYNMYAALEPALIALPVSGTAINVNTAPPLVLRMIVKGLSEREANELHEDLAKNPVTDIKDFLSNKLVTGKPVSTTGIDVRSGYFMIHAYANIGRVRAHQDSMIHRVSATDVKTLLRSEGDV